MRLTGNVRLSGRFLRHKCFFGDLHRPAQQAIIASIPCRLTRMKTLFRIITDCSSWLQRERARLRFRFEFDAVDVDSRSSDEVNAGDQMSRIFVHRVDTDER